MKVELVPFLLIVQKLSRKYINNNLAHLFVNKRRKGIKIFKCRKITCTLIKWWYRLMYKYLCRIYAIPINRNEINKYS